MRNRKLSRIITAGCLAALLALPGAASADTGGPGAWEWLVNFWQEGLSALWTSGESAPGPAPGSESGTGGAESNGDDDQGHGIDPNG